MPEEKQASTYQFQKYGGKSIMKKRLIALVMTLCVAVTLIAPASAVSGSKEDSISLETVSSLDMPSIVQPNGLGGLTTNYHWKHTKTAAGQE